MKSLFKKAKNKAQNLMVVHINNIKTDSGKAIKTINKLMDNERIGNIVNNLNLQYKIIKRIKIGDTQQTIKQI